MQPIRNEIYTVTEFEHEDAEDHTLRDAIEWYKKVLNTMRALGVPTKMETGYVNQRWVALIAGVAKRERIPAGALSYFLAELAKAEQSVVEIADESADIQ